MSKSSTRVVKNSKKFDNAKRIVVASTTFVKALEDAGVLKTVPRNINFGLALAGILLNAGFLKMNSMPTDVIIDARNESQRLFPSPRIDIKKETSDMLGVQ